MWQRIIRWYPFTWIGLTSCWLTRGSDGRDLFTALACTMNSGDGGGSVVVPGGGSDGLPGRRYGGRDAECEGGPGGILGGG
jgi:hypothetical protein